MTVLFIWLGTLFVAPLTFAVYFDVKERLEDRATRQRIEQLRGAEDRQVAALDAVWEMPAFEEAA
jgi:hypothetical protein